MPTASSTHLHKRKNLVKGALAATFLFLWAAIRLHAADADVWKPLQFLAGTWAGDGQAQGMAGKGTVTFSWEVSHQLLVYREHTEFAAHADHPAATYEAMMVIYKDPSSGQIEANYYGSDQQVTHYKLSGEQRPGTAQFISEAAAGPVFRLTYFLKTPADLALNFEVKLAGADAFQLLASARGHKQ